MLHHMQMQQNGFLTDLLLCIKIRTARMDIVTSVEFVSINIQTRRLWMDHVVIVVLLLITI